MHFKFILHHTIMLAENKNIRMTEENNRGKVGAQGADGQYPDHTELRNSRA